MARWSLVSEILKQPNITDIIYRLLESDRHYKIDEEDLQAVNYSAMNYGASSGGWHKFHNK